MSLVKIFLCQNFRNACTDEKLNTLVKKFREYKEGKTQPAEFGRDVPYWQRPATPDTGLWHLHLRDEHSKNWDLKYIQLNSKTSDTALVYCTGFYNKNHYLLIDILKPAHIHYERGHNHMYKLVDIANDFRMKF